MALQGTLDTFELPDVLRLLSSTRKSGRLHLRGDRGEGSVWLADGEVVGVRTDAAPSGDVSDGLFDLLRARDGRFEFEPGVTADQPQAPLEVEPLLAATEQRLADWREIEAVVPSLHAWVSLAPELPHPELTIEAATWRMVAAIGSGQSVGDLARALDLDEVAVSRVVRDLVVLGLGSVTDAPAPAAAPTLSWEPEAAAPTAGHDAASYDAPVQDLGGYQTNGYEAEPTERPQPSAAEAAYDGPANGFDLGRFGADAAPVGAQPAWSPEPSPDGPGPVFAVDDPAGYGEVAEATYQQPAALADIDEDADEVARQLAMLSPRAAQAVAAAAAADTEVERDAYLEALDEGDEPINRGLLLKFLSSVKS